MEASRVDRAKRLECVELAPAFEHGGWPESASKLDALQTLREVRRRMKRVELAPAFEHGGWPESASKLDALQTLREVRRRMECAVGLFRLACGVIPYGEFHALGLKFTAVRVLLQNTKIGLYYAGPNHWVSKSSQALDFKKIERATQFASEQKLADVQVVRGSDRPGSK